MVAKITIPGSIQRALNYNEQKSKEGVADCIYAHNFLKEAEQLNFYEKLKRFESLMALNKRAATNTIHISLNFGLNEKIGREKLVEIATVYMEKIGFGAQPYLVYQHHDAGHPHVHIVSTNIQKDGKRISLHNLGKNESTKARKEIEIAYKLVRAEQQADQNKEINPVNVERVKYGKSPTKRAITNVLDAVLPTYKYASLAELNAVLKLYNVMADRGCEQGIIFQKRGLLYRVLDEKGNKIGVPIKASSIYSKPTLAFLESKFTENEIAKQECRKNVRLAIDWIMVSPPKNLQAFKLALEKEKISLAIRQNENGIVYGLTYIDHNTKTVFNGSDIGKQYSAKAILEKFGITQIVTQPQKPVDATNAEASTIERATAKEKQTELSLPRIVEEIMNPTEEWLYVPYELKKRKKKKRRSAQ
ncbi:relaxase/mobilization nuclease domain-containing protein [Terrimonas alba]|uniref:relaxase/mobilization nuclease domain-containing protein n=1 Tax=Terrimonas alba TaxID=3349636 RepID=UPI0035F29CE0